MPARLAIDQAESAESQNRTGDTTIFSRVLYQLSYLGLNVQLPFVRRKYFTYMWGDCQASDLLNPRFNRHLANFDPGRLGARQGSPTYAPIWRESCVLVVDPKHQC